MLGSRVETAQDADDITKLIAEAKGVSASALIASSIDKNFSNVPKRDIRIGPGSKSDKLFEGGRFDSSGALTLACRLSYSVSDRVASFIETLCNYKHVSNSAKEVGLRHIGKECLSLMAEVLKFEVGLIVDQGMTNDVDPLDQSLSAIFLHEDFAFYINEKYPVLIDKLVRRVGLKCEAYVECLHRISSARLKIREHLGIEAEEGFVSDIKWDMGDSHNGARSVAIITTKNGDRFVYKPRPVDGEIAFRKIAEKVNRYIEFDIVTLDSVAEEDHAFFPFVSASKPTSDGARQKYFYSYGANVALAQLVGVTDIHHENVIATESGPIIIDLETTSIPLRYGPGPTDDGAQFISEYEFVAQSPFFTAMIDPVFFDNQLNGSPLSGVKRVKEFSHILLKDASKTVELVSSDLLRDDHYVRWSKRDASRIIDGYRDVLEVFLTKRRIMLPYVEATLKGCRTRIILKFTSAYAKLLAALESPFALESYYRQDAYLKKIWRSALTRPMLKRVTYSEVIALEDGDVPMFYSTTDSLDLYTQDGVKINDFFAETGLDWVKRTIFNLSQTTIDEFVSQVRDSLQSRLVERQEADSEVRPDLYSSNSEKRNLFVEVKDRINRAPNLRPIQPESDYTHETRFRTLGTDLYTGLVGIALAYSEAERHGSVSDDQLSSAILFDRAVERMPPAETDGRLGICVGLGGYVFSGAVLAKNSNNQFYLDFSCELLKTGCKRLWSDRHYDVFSGAAGLLLAANALHRVSPRKESRAAIEQIAYFLMSNRVHLNGFHLWYPSTPHIGASIFPQTGYAHGSTGIASALLRTSDVHNIPLDDVVDNVNRLVDASACNSKLNFADQPVESISTEPDMGVWCHGAPGVLIYEADLLRVDSSQETFSRIDRARRFTEAHLEFENLSLCHGTMGNIDAYLYAQSLADRFSLQDSRLEFPLKKNIVETDVRCGTPYGAQSLGLFLGISGIALGKLRSEKPDAVPSIVAFEGISHE